ncbi:MAG TPA: hypothetical protein VHU92_27780, partial [Streptosporangiaceae bacterium]|nr:hypothetical protein [Streptosporangiaceae bacterium]
LMIFNGGRYRLAAAPPARRPGGPPRRWPPGTGIPGRPNPGRHDRDRLTLEIGGQPVAIMD